MRRDWPQTAVAYAESVTKALRDLGGVDLARAAQAVPARRRAAVPPLLEQLGLAALDVWGDEEESAAVVLGVRAAGAVVLPWPLVHTLAVPVSLRAGVDAVYLTAGTPRRLDHADLFDRAVAVDVVARTARGVRAVAAHPAPLDPFASDVDIFEANIEIELDVAVSAHILLSAFWVAGALGTVVDRATVHARDREQFGRPIGSFGEIRWRLADLALARDGLDELALHTWWLLRRGTATEADVLALRVQMIEAAQTVLANGHQVLGAMGLCEEHDIAVVDRHLQPALHRPVARLGSTQLLAQAVARHGFDGLFPVPPLD